MHLMEKEGKKPNWNKRGNDGATQAYHELTMEKKH